MRYVIGPRSNSDQRCKLRGILGKSLQSAFAAVGYPNALRAQFTTSVLDALVEKASLTLAPASPRELHHAAHPTLPSIKLPETAPAQWNDDRLPAETPPEFIKRHYGPWLRSDARGVTRAYIGHVDPPLYNALAAWLHRNRHLPNDCPLPTRSEVARQAVLHEKPLTSEQEAVVREYWRRKSILRLEKDRTRD